MSTSRIVIAAGAISLYACGGAAPRGDTTPPGGSTPARTPAAAPASTPAAQPASAPAAQPATAPLGSLKNPVRCFFPTGQREYLRRLRCPDGEAPIFRRVGSYGMGPDKHIIDGYRVRCADGKPLMVFMDMYHKGYLELAPPPGFKIDNTP